MSTVTNAQMIDIFFAELASKKDEGGIYGNVLKAKSHRKVKRSAVTEDGVGPKRQAPRATEKANIIAAAWDLLHEDEEG